MPVPQEPKESPTQPLLDQWMEHRKAVENLFRTLVKPEDAQNVQHITTMQKRLASMMKLTNELNPVKTGNAIVGTG